MLARTFHGLAVLFVFASSCGGQGGPKAPSAGTGATFTCKDSGDDTKGTTSSSYAPGTFEACTFEKGKQWLQVRFKDNELEVNVAAFQGPNTFTTGAKDTETNVFMRNAEVSGRSLDVSNGEVSCKPKACSVTVKGDPAKGPFDVVVSCTQMAAGGVGCLMCDVSNASFSLHVPSCESLP